jgi:hypothetical protein
MVRSNQFLGWTILPELRLTVDGDQAFFNFSKPDRETQTFVAGATLSYLPDINLFADIFVNARFLQDTLSPKERTIETGLRLRWNFRKVEIVPSLQFFDRRRGDTDTKDFRATLRVIRRF